MRWRRSSAARPRWRCSRARGTGRGWTGPSWLIAWSSSSARSGKHLTLRRAMEAVADETDGRYDSPLWRVAPVLVAALISAVYLIVEPRTVDLAASTFRANLFGADGFPIWHHAW